MITPHCGRCCSERPRRNEGALGGAIPRRYDDGRFMTATVLIGIALVALFIIGKLLMSVGKFFLWLMLFVGIGLLAFAGAQHMGWI